MTDAAAIDATTLSCSVTCKNLEAAIGFYRDAIGLAVAETYEHDGKVVAAVVAAGDCRIVLNQDDGKLGWGPADVDAAAARIMAAAGRC